MNSKVLKSDARAQATSVQRSIELCQAVVRLDEEDTDGQEILFAELDDLLDVAQDHEVTEILTDPRFLSVKDRIHEIRAHYEYRREMLLADEIIANHSTQVAEDFRSHDWYDKALDFETTALAPYQRKHILFVGSGPFPTSPMAFLRNNPGARVTCMERYKPACERAEKVAAIYDLPDLEIINTDGAAETDFTAYDCVIVGLVVGAVDDHKSNIVDQFMEHVPPGILLCFRTADGSGRVIYPSVDMSAFDNVNHTLLEAPPHKSFTLVIVDR